MLERIPLQQVVSAGGETNVGRKKRCFRQSPVNEIDAPHLGGALEIETGSGQAQIPLYVTPSRQVVLVEDEAVAESR